MAVVKFGVVFEGPQAMNMLTGDAGRKVPNTTVFYDGKISAAIIPSPTAQPTCK